VGVRNKKPDPTNKKALAVSSLSGHGAALFLSAAVPFQLVGRVDSDILAGALGLVPSIRLPVSNYRSRREKKRRRNTASISATRLLSCWLREP
jgi:hypothetical protein